MSMSPRLLRPRATGFSPKNISGLAGWWDADDSSTITVSTGVSSWADKSGNGRTLVQTTENNQPTRVLNSLNGKAVISFDGVNDTLGASFTLSQPCQHFVVFKYNAAYVSGNPRAWDGFATSGGLHRGSATNMVMNYGASDDQATVTDAEMQAFGIWETEANGADSFIRRAGVRRDTTNNNIGSNSPSGIRLAVFQNGFSAPGNVSFAEVLIYGRVLSAEEASRVRKYLGTKYNLPYA